MCEIYVVASQANRGGVIVSKTTTQGGITRRSFLLSAGATAALAATAGVTGCAPKSQKDAQGDKQGTGSDPFADCDVVYGCCSPECQHHSLKGYIRDGKLVKVEAGEVNECGICPRGIARVEMCNSDKRLTKPLKRTGEKGSGQFEEISWDEAIDLIVQKINEAIASDGSKSITYNVNAGNFSNLTSDLWPAFFSWVGDGTTTIVDNTCCAGIDAGMTPILGNRAQATRDQFSKSDYVIFWGNNPAITLGGYFERFEEVVKNGGKLVTIDPYYSESADKSQEWLQPYPGSDTGVAYAMLNTIITEKLYDESYLVEHTTAACLVDKSSNAMALSDAGNKTSYQVYDSDKKALVPYDDGSAHPALSVAGTEFEAQYVTVFDLVAEQAAKMDDETLRAETGCNPDDVKRIARDYAAADHAMIIQNMGGYERTEFGGWATAVGVYLALFTGNIGHEGDGVYDAGGIMNIKDVGSAYEVNENVSVDSKLHYTVFGESILADKPNKINFLLVACANPLAQLPNTNMVKKGFEKIPFVVTLDMFMTATALYSDLVLPVTAVFETENVTASMRSNIVSLSEAKLTPPGEAKSDLQIAALLADKLGFGDKFNQEPKVYIDNVVKPLGLSYDQLEKEKAVDMRDADYIAFKDGDFPTDSKRAELFVPSWEEEGFPPIPEYRRPQESLLNATKYPFAAVQRKSYRTVHTTFSELDQLQKAFDEVPPIIINSQDAAAKGIASGDTVTVFNDRGTHTGKAKVTSKLLKGVIVLENGWQDGIGGSSSAVTSNLYPTLGTIHCCNSTLVDVRKGE